MPAFASLPLPREPSAIAPDASEVRVLLGLAGGSMAHFRLEAAQVSRPVTHRRVEEIWYVIAGAGQMWRRQDGREEITELAPGLCLTIPAGTHFQFRAAPRSALEAIAVTMPPWPGDDEAVAVAGPWVPASAGRSEAQVLPHNQVDA